MGRGGVYGRLDRLRAEIRGIDAIFGLPEYDGEAIVRALNASGARVSFAEIVTDKGHDAFLLDEPEMFATVRGFLNHTAQDISSGSGA